LPNILLVDSTLRLPVIPNKLFPNLSGSFRDGDSFRIELTLATDQSGKVRIWDTVNQEHILKNEFQPFGGPVRDLSWSPDNQRIAVGGEGREKFAHVFMADTGTSVGEITGQTKPINSIDFRPARPYRVITGCEDNTIGIFEGPPFKFKCTKKVYFATSFPRSSS